jgi:hypothetical protein
VWYTGGYHADVINIFKVKTRNAIKLVVKLTSHYLRNSILEGRKKPSIFTDELGVPGMRNQLFFQEDLTKMNQDLLFEARRATKLTDSQFTHA